MEKRRIWVRGTRVGSDGTGRYRGEDGKYYYGNPQNRYLTRSLDQQRRDADEAAIQAQPDRTANPEKGDCQRQSPFSATVDDKAGASRGLPTGALPALNSPKKIPAGGAGGDPTGITA
ncbi:hypothetical protein [uncultured Oscillibacter sp.]|uniref:hypothetical protein n=1 Tax=uncultured Oscillibacter sp. TaxID=876091 RepID=UPI002803B611|nr:hypothetical protein [uncultured Oscillibacter sp.]